MSLFSVTHTLARITRRTLGRLFVVRARSGITPLTFADVGRHRHEEFGPAADRTPCRCSYCRHIRRRARRDAA